MFIVDRYILRTFAKLAVVGFMSFAGLYVVIDVMSNLDELLGYAKTQSGGMARVLVDYYGPRLLMLFDRTAGLVAMVAAMLSITLLQRNQELTALLAAGISKVRVATPLFCGALLFSVLGIANRELLLPQVRDRLGYLAQDLSGQLGRKVTPHYDNHTMLMFDGAKAFPKLRRIDAPQVRLTAHFASWGKKIKAAQAWYVAAENNRPAGYLFKGVTSPAELSETQSVEFDGSLVLLSPKDTPWLKSDECFVASQLTFEQLTGNTTFRRYLSTPELILGLNNRSLDYGSDVKVIVHNRFLTPVLDLMLFMLGIPLVLARESRSIFVAAGVCAVLVAAYLMVTTACHVAGGNYLLRPALAAWMPLALFGPAAYALARPLWD